MATVAVHRQRAPTPGITGYGECSDGRNPYGVVWTVRDFERS